MGLSRSQWPDWSMRVMKISHTSFKVESTGLHINPKYPHLRASPDGPTSCTCCGDGILEIKCPYSLRDSIPTSAPYLNSSMDGEYKLSTTHEPTILRFCVLDTPGYSYGERILYTVQLKKNLQLLTVTDLFSTERYLYTVTPKYLYTTRMG